MPFESIRIINKFYGGIVRDDKSRIFGSASNVEELDIFENDDFIRAEQIFTNETLPATTEIYAHDAGDDDTMYAYGRATEATAGRVRILSVASGGADNPSDFTTLFTSTDTTNLATRVSDFKFFRTTEAQPTYLYYINGAGSTWRLMRYNITAASEALVGTLTGLTGSFDRPTIKVIFGELFVCHNNLIAKVSSGGTYTNAAFTLPAEWQAVDIIPVGDIALILCRNRNRLLNRSKGFWWDLVSTTQFNDSFDIPSGGPCWIVNHQETIKLMCAINGRAYFYQLSASSQGGVPIELTGMRLSSIGVELTTRPISQAKMVSQKDKILYFGLLKTDKTGVYAIGKLDNNSPTALILSKRFGTSDYSLHRPTSLYIQGPNYYGAFDNNGTETAVRCETNNSPSRSSNASYDSLWIDLEDPLRDKTLNDVIIATKQLPTGTSLTTSIATDYVETFTTINRADGTTYNTTNAVLGRLKPVSFSSAKAYKVRIAFTSSGTNSPILQAIALKITTKDELANN